MSDLQRQKRQLSRMREELAIAQNNFNEAIKEMKEKFNCERLENAEKLKEELELEIEQLNKKFNSLKDKIEKILERNDE